MLNNKCEKVLKILVQQDSNGITYFKSVENVQEHIPKFDNKLVEECLFNLNSQGYINGFKGDNTISSISLTYDGKYYFEFKRKKYQEFLFKSIFTPIIVSLITTVIATLIINYLK